MNTAIRPQVLAFLQNLPKEKSEQYNKAFEYFRQLVPTDHAAERSYNAGYTERNLNNLLYDIKKKCKITDLDVLSEVVETETKIISLNPATETETDVLTVQTTEQITETVEVKPIEVEGKIREEFTFLDDENCPNELKILVADKLTAWKKYKTAHTKLAAHGNKELELTEAEIAELAEISVKSYEENQAIYDELNHYSEHKEILGKHSIFKTLKVEREVMAMTNDELHKFIGSTATYFTKKKKLLLNEKDAKVIATINEGVEERKQKLALVKKKLNIS